MRQSVLRVLLFIFVSIEKKASSLAGATAKLMHMAVDHEFKGLCKDFADKFESYSGVVLKSRSGFVGYSPGFLRAY